MLCWGVENMQILQLIIQRVSVDVVDDLPGLCASHLAMLPLLSVPRLNASGANALGIKGTTMQLVRSFGHGRCRLRRHKVNNRAGDFVAASHVFAGRQAFHLFRIRVQGISVPVPHLVMPHAQITGCNGPIAMQAFTTNFLAAPLVFGRPMLLNSLVVHQTKAMGRMFSTAIFDSAKWHCLFPIGCTDCTTSKCLGNNYSVPNVRWIGERIDAVALINKAQAATKDVAELEAA